MFAIITDRNGNTAATYSLKDTDPLDCDQYAARFAADMGIDLEGAEPQSRIPDGCEDYTVALTEDPQGVRHWCRENYLVKQEEF